MNDMNFEELQQIVSVCLDEIVKLKEENIALKTELEETKLSVSSLLDALRKVSSASVSFEKTNEARYNAVCSALDNIKYEIKDSKSDNGLFYPKIADIDETIKAIVNDKKSLARFGDGEFSIMSGYIRHGFQKYDERLSRLLRETIKASEDDFLVGIGDTFGNLDIYNQNSKQEIRAYMTGERRRDILRYLSSNKVYHNAYITRPYAMYNDNSKDGPRNRFEALKKIWEDRDVIFIEGEKTRLGVGNDLFDNAKSIRRIIAPATDSFSCYDRILEAALAYANEDVLFLIALGPTAGVLAYDIFKSGYQAIDIGHLDLEYEWMKNGFGGRSEVKTKYNNEYPGGDNVEPVMDTKYEKEIIWKY